MVESIGGQDKNRGLKASADSLHKIKQDIRSNEQKVSETAKEINQISKQIDSLHGEMRNALVSGDAKTVELLDKQVQDLKARQETLINLIDAQAAQNSTSKAKGPSVFGDGFGQN
jgi:uncharacterized protein (DUF3084 family)